MAAREMMFLSKAGERIEVLFGMNQMSKTQLDVADLIQGLKTLVFDESEYVLKSPMRTHEYSHCVKPYGQQQSSTSRSVNGVMRVVESDGVSRSDPWRHQFLQTNSVSGRTSLGLDDVDLGDINQWVNMCSKNPQVISDFINGCTEELNRKIDSNQFSEKSFTTLPQYKADGMSICSNSSSQISSPAQSPSEHNVTSPESNSCDENSLYYSMSPIIPSLECVNIKPVDDMEDTDRLLCSGGTTQKENSQLKYMDTNGLLNVAGSINNIRTNVNSETVSPNIGTLMLNLAEDTYESTIDLSHFTNTLNPDPSFTSIVIEKERLNEKLHPKAKQSAWTRISQLNIDLLGKGDKEGDTQLMILLASEKVTLEYIYVIVERLLKENPKYLSSRNELNQDALYLAALILKWEPIVASYIAEALIRGKQDVDKKYGEGNTLLHCLAEKGDTHAKVIERLLHLRKPDNTPAFDVNSKNNRGYTPLHVACEFHKPEGIRTYQTIRLLLENGADCSEKEYIDENTPLHILINQSCDPELLNILLENTRKFRRKNDPQPTTIPNRQGNTSLHLACRRNTLDINVQKEVVEALLRHGAMIHLKNINGCVPSVLVDSSRKQDIKNSLHSFRLK